MLHRPIPLIVSLDTLLLGSAKVDKVKIFSGPYYMIKRVQTFVSGVQKSVLVDFISQNKVKISSCSYHCQQLDKCRPLSQQSKRRYQCGRFGAGLG